MKVLAHRKDKDRTQFGIFHNFGEDIETGYVCVHFFGATLELYWSK